MRTFVRGIIVVGLALAVGCSNEPKPAQTPEQLQGRLTAADAMTNASEKNDVLQVIAQDAADSGAGDVVLKALGKITNASTRNDTAEACALSLAKRGDTRAATAIAQQISNASLKNDVLAKIAKGD
jgi:hypothetical protein